MIQLRYANLFSRVLLLVDRIDEAVEYRDMELKLCMRLGSGSLEYALALKSASLFFKDCGRKEEALQCAQDAMVLLEKYLGPDVSEVVGFAQEMEELVFEKELEDIPDSHTHEKNECLICMESKISQYGLLHESTIHTGFCETCLHALQSQNINSCPLCNQRIERVIKVF